jgi:CheY-like chemotaxis protein
LPQESGLFFSVPPLHPHDEDNAVPALICIVEPDPLTLRLMAEIIEGEGFTTLHLSEAAGALAVIKEKRPDLLVLDPTLETQDAGWTLLEAIRSDDATRALPVIVCTSDVAGAEKHSTLLAKPPETIVLIKPFDPQALITKIKNTLANDWSGREPSERTRPFDVVD